MSIKVGDRVVCIKEHLNPVCSLKNGREYIVYDSLICKCNKQIINVGINLPFTMSEMNCECGERMNTNGNWFLYADRFRKVEERTNYVKLEIEIEEPIYS